MARAITAVILFTAAFQAPPAPTQAPSFRTTLFRFQTDEFWLNLHDFLYVLGRDAAKMADASQEAVAGAPDESRRGLASLTEAEQKTWLQAIAFYAAGPSRKDAVFDASLAAVTHAVADAGDAATLASASIEPGLRATLEAAAPVYRKAWWPAHHAANVAWRGEIQSLLQRHGAAVLAYITHAYELPWASDGYPVHLSGYANWAGAYSTTGNLLVVSSLDRASQGLSGLETAFHEGMHQWDDTINGLLVAEARRTNKRLPRGVSHAMIFFTAGEAVRHVVPDHTPVADAQGVWGRGMEALKPALQETWKPFLEGKGTRDEAIRALVARLGN
ncbi:MAG TPA: hypothetical protein VNG89_16560 [Vicinamibacterales bacterium]|nr:hypothetical protein [Vicinamibacterales bacterium]